MRETGPGSAIFAAMTRKAHRLLFLLCAALATLMMSGAADAADRVYPTAEAVVPLAPGARVPSATVQSVHGESVDLADLMRESGALLVFYRGGW